MTVTLGPIPDLPDPPKEYSQEYMNRLVSLVEQGFYLLSQRQPLVGTTANINRLPTSATGLRSGDLWNDLGTIKIV